MEREKLLLEQIVVDLLENPAKSNFMITTEFLARSFSLSISGETHEFIIYAMRQ